jgi:hypothetical protein
VSKRIYFGLTFICTSQDTGPAVRKRVVKLFKVIYDLVPKKSVRTEICCKLVGLVDDEEDSVKVNEISALAR